MSGLWLVSHIMLWVFMIVLLVGMIALGREIGLLHRRLPPMGARGGSAGPAVGEEIPTLHEVTLSGTPVVLGKDARTSSLIVFMSPDCGTCADLAVPLRSISRSEKDISVVVVGPGDRKVVDHFATRHKLTDLPVIASHELGATWNIQVTPYTVAVDRDGVVRAKGITNNVEHLESLVDSLRSSERRERQVLDITTAG